LDKSETINQVIAEETLVDIELDRKFFDKLAAKKTNANTTITTETPSQSLVNQNITSIESVPNTPEGPTPSSTTTTLQKHIPLDDSGKPTLETIEKCLKKGAKKFQIIMEKGQESSLPYSCALSKEMFASWNIGKRKSVEWQRARRLREYLIYRLNVEWSTKQIVLWCREHGLTPIIETTSPFIEDSETLESHPIINNSGIMHFCKFCGSIHQPSDRFDTLPKPCGNSIASLDPSNQSTYCALDKLFDLLTLEQTSKIEKLSSTETDTKLGLDEDAELMLYTATVAFSKHLVRESLTCVQNQKQGRGELSLKVLVPMHVFKAISNTTVFDFLTNKGLQNKCFI